MYANIYKNFSYFYHLVVVSNLIVLQLITFTYQFKI